MSKEFILTTDELFGSYCYIEQKRYGVPNEKFLYKIIGKFTSNAWSNVPVDANDKEPHIFNHSEEVVNVVCCGVCEDKIERYKLSDVEIISNKDQQLADLEAKLAEKEKEIKARDKRIDRLEENYYQETRNLEWVNEQLTEAEKQLEKQASIHYGHLQELVSKIDQDKTSFAIAELEKVKDYTQHIQGVLINYIENQINRLKGEK